MYAHFRASQKLMSSRVICISFCKQTVVTQIRGHSLIWSVLFAYVPQKGRFIWVKNIFWKVSYPARSDALIELTYLLTVEAPIITAADDKFSGIFLGLIWGW